MRLHQGRIIFAEVLDSNDENLKDRPLVIISTAEEIAKTGEVEVACGTTKPRGLPVEVPIPWHRNGHPWTKLYEKTSIVTNWLRTVPIDEIRREAGVVPPKQLHAIITMAKS